MDGTILGGVMRLRRRNLIFWLVILLSLTMPALAREILVNQDCMVGPDEVIAGNLFTACQHLEVHGRVTGDVIGLAYRATIDGEVGGSLYVAGAEMDITGQVARDIHYLGIRLHLGDASAPDSAPDAAQDAASDAEQEAAGESSAARMGGSLLGGTLSTTVGPGVQLPRGITLVGYQLLILGEVTGEINFWGSALFIDGPVRGNVYASVGDPAASAATVKTLLIPLRIDVELVNPGLVVGPNGAIDGLLTYSGPVEGIVEGSVSQPPVFTQTHTNGVVLEEPAALTRYFEQAWAEFTTMLFFGLGAILLVPGAVKRPIPYMSRRPLSTLAIGMLTFILSFPVFVIVAALSIALLITLLLLGLAGIVVALTPILLVINLGGIVLFYWVAIILGRLVVAFAAGRLAVQLVTGERTQAIVAELAAMAVGVAGLALLGPLPLIGILINALALFIGLGAIVALLQVIARRVRLVVLADEREGESFYLPLPVDEPEKPPAAPLPVAPAIGMANLPEGFRTDYLED
jgi:hypothetical protein